MADIQSPTLIWIKGGLFLLLGTISSVLLLMQSPHLRTAALLAIVVWSFCRFYYFAFYVIQHYVDPAYRFTGLFDFLKYAITQRRRRVASPD